MKKIIEKELDKFNIQKEHWEEVLSITRKKLLLVFLGGALVSTILWLIIFWIYTQTGFIL